MAAKGRQSSAPESSLHVAALVLVPTRELALQTAHVLKDLAKHLKLQIMTSTGGTDLKDDIMRLSKAVHVIVATPGRIHDLAQRNLANLGQCKHLVMDEVRAVFVVVL